MFSLIELEHCVLRGCLSRPEALPKVGYKIPQPDDDRLSYALTAVDQRINFILSNGSLSGLDTIYVLTPEVFEDALTEASRTTLEYCLNINTSKRSLTLPRSCLLYRQDFAPTNGVAGEKSDNNDILTACRKYFGSAQSENIDNLLDSAKQENKPVSVRFREADFHSYLTLNIQ